MSAARGGQVNRNDPCPCGSGKKYKKCCMDKPGVRPRLGPSGGVSGAAGTGRRVGPSRDDLLARADAARRAGRHEQAIALYEQVLRDHPRDTSALAGLGRVRFGCGRPEEAIPPLRKALEHDRKNVQLLLTLSEALYQSGETTESLRHARRAAALDPRRAGPHSLIALCLERTEGVDAAVEAAEAGEQLEPGNSNTLLILGRLLARQKKYVEAQSRLAEVAEHESDPKLAYRAQKELGVVLDKQGEHDAAFDAFRQGGIARSAAADVQSLDRDAMFRQIAEYEPGFAPDLLDRWKHLAGGDDGPTPAFLVGFPRSGTTMTEQILAAHPRVTTTDEAPLIPDLKKSLRGLFPKEGAMPDLLAALDEVDVRQLRSDYRESAAALVGKDLRGMVFLDKLPLNLIDVGLINVIFPEARIIVALRDPRDVCLSCFMQRFAMNTAMVNFLWWDRTAEFYAAVMNLWLRQRERITLRHLEIRYEDTVTDLEGQGRRLLELLDLEWDPAVLTFHEKARERFIATPSFAAVTEAPHTRAVQRWRKYERHFESVMTALSRFVREFGYGEDEESSPGH